MAQEHGVRVIIATKLRHGDANTMMAEGGIQAATKETKDSPYYHYLDVLGAVTSRTLRNWPTPL